MKSEKATITNICEGKLVAIFDDNLEKPMTDVAENPVSEKRTITLTVELTPDENMDYVIQNCHAKLTVPVRKLSGISKINSRGELVQLTKLVEPELPLADNVTPISKDEKAKA